MRENILDFFLVFLGIEELQAVVNLIMNSSSILIPCNAHVVALHLGSHLFFIGTGIWQHVALLVFFLHPHLQIFTPKTVAFSSFRLHCAVCQCQFFIRINRVGRQSTVVTVIVSGLLHQGVTIGFSGEKIGMGTT